MTKAKVPGTKAQIGTNALWVIPSAALFPIILWVIVGPLTTSGFPLILCLIGAILGGILFGILAAEWSARGKTSSLIFVIAIILGILLPLGSVLFGNETIRSLYGETGDVLDAPSGPPPLTPYEIAEVEKEWLQFPVERQGFKSSPLETSITLNRTSGPPVVYAMNFAKLQSFSCMVTVGQTQPGHHSISVQTGTAADWRFVRTYPVSRPATPNDNIGLLRRNHPHTSDPRFQLITAHFSGVQHPNAVTIRTEGLVHSGRAIQWGQIWKEIGGRELQTDYVEVNFLKVSAEGLPLPWNASRHYPTISFQDGAAIDPATGNVKIDPSREMKCIVPINRIPFSTIENGDVLVIDVPPEMENVLVFVNCLLR